MTSSGRLREGCPVCKGTFYQDENHSCKPVQPDIEALLITLRANVDGIRFHPMPERLIEAFEAQQATIKILRNTLIVVQASIPSNWTSLDGANRANAYSIKRIEAALEETEERKESATEVETPVRKD